MRKKIIIIGIIVLILLGVGYFLYTRDNIRFKFSYELLNKEKYPNGKIIKVNIPIDNRIKCLNTKKLNKFLESGTGILYFGYSSCPWCRNIVPILIDVAKENNINTINYVDTHSINVKKTDAYEKLYDYLREDEDGEKRFAVPVVYVIKNGKVLDYHISTVSSYKDPYSGMNDEQIKELKDIYNEMIKEIK